VFSESEKEDSMKRFGIGALIGLVGAWFLDPSSGKRRRHVTRDRALAFFRGGGRRTARLGRTAAAQGYGAVQKATHLREEPKEFDDATLKAKVETEIFRQAGSPKGNVDVNAQRGIVQLRGEVESPELIDELVERTRKVQGVREVENLLHLPRTEAPMHQ
jgi:osmotically-inducible protein OsmY